MADNAYAAVTPINNEILFPKINKLNTNSFLLSRYISCTFLIYFLFYSLTTKMYSHSFD